MSVNYQVLNFDNKYKKSDLCGLNNELTERKGSGNYDLSRTKYNVELVPMYNNNLMSTIYKKLDENNIQYNSNKKDLNLINGAVITSGQDFFKSLGMKFKETDTKYESGEHKGEYIKCCDIRKEEDVPEKVLEFFKDCNEYMCNLVGKENVVNSVIHFDENTPHLHFYFLPVVDKVQRKVFETDSEGKRIMKSHINKDGKETLVPVLKKDENGKNIYTTEYGKFLNSDQFWKDKGGKLSFTKILDDFNEYLQSKGYLLDRGEVGANKEHETKLEHTIKELEAKKDNLIEIIDFNKIDKETQDKLNKVNSEEVLNPSRNFLGQYKEYDVDQLVDYSKDLNKQLILKDNSISKKENRINKLEKEIKELKNNKIIKDKDKIISNQKNIIDKQDKEINHWKGLYEEVSKRLSNTVQYFKMMLERFAKAVYIVMGKEPPEEINTDTFQFHVDNIINKHYHKNKHQENNKDKSDDFEL